MTDLHKPHYHEDDRGILQRCYHTCKVGLRTWLIAALLATLAFPIEHGIWEQVQPLRTAAEHVENAIGNAADYLGIGVEEDDGGH